MEPSTYAGLIALLSIQRSFYRSVYKSMEKIGSIVVGVALGAAFAFTFGRSPIAIGVATILVILVMLRLNWQDSIVLATVTAVNLMAYSSGVFFIFAGKQLLLAFIGVLCALSINYLFTPYHKQEVEKNLEEVLESLARLLEQLSLRFTGKESWDREFFKATVDRLHAEIDKGIILGKLLREEQRFKFVDTTPAERYQRAFSIFSSQVDRVWVMFTLTEKMTERLPQMQTIARLIRLIIRIQDNRFHGCPVPERLFQRVAANLLEEKEALPRTWEEFESRAALLHFYGELQRYYNDILKLPVILSKARRTEKKGEKKDRQHNKREEIYGKRGFC